jgi:hypothetical protein
MFYNILDKKRLAILPLLKKFKAGFYLAGGTGLALQIGHRDSIDFDFFSLKNFETGELYAQVKEVFAGHKILKVQEEKNTLTVFVDENIKFSFFSYPYKLIGKLVNEENLKIASIEDIAIMKLAAVVSRATNKDYIDLYFILKKISLKDVLKKMQKKLPDLDANLVLKSLVYFSDIIYEPIKFKNGRNIDFTAIKKFIEREVSKV